MKIARTGRRTFLGSAAALTGAALLPRSSKAAEGARPMEFTNMEMDESGLTAVNLSDFDGLGQAIDRCRELGAARLVIPPGEYHFKSNEAVAAFDTLMSGSINPESLWGGIGGGYHKSISLTGMENLLIDATGAKFIFHGLTQPFEIDNCRNLKIRGLAVDWARTPFTAGVVTASSPGSVEVDVFDEYPVRGGEPAYAAIAYDPVRRSFGPAEFYDVRARLELVSPQKVRVKHPLASRHQPGEWLVIRHLYFRPVFHLYGSERIFFEDVTMHAGTAMSILAHRCRDLDLNRVKVVPSGERPMSINADATHFISCRGQVSLRECEFTGMGDDGANVHGFYQAVEKIIDRKTLLLTLPGRTQDGRFDFPDPGDMVEFARGATLKPYAENVIAESTPEENNWRVTVKLESPLPRDFVPGDLVSNVSQLPRFLMTRSRVYANRARAALVQTRGALIEDCEFDRCTGTGVHIDTAVGWWETAAARDITVRGNRITGCGYGPGTYLSSSGVAIGVESPLPATGVHQRITIEENLIEGSGNTGIHVGSAQDVVLRANKIGKCRNPIRVKLSRDIEIS